MDNMLRDAKMIYLQCPLNFLFGIPCPLCGITRAFLSVLRGDFASAFYYHPLWPLVLLVILFIVLKQTGILRVSYKSMNIGAVIIALVFLVCFILRHVFHSPVVEVDFEDSLICKIYSIF